jgi:DNA uptake protein ComE-like DNA-binding protein
MRNLFLLVLSVLVMLPAAWPQGQKAKEGGWNELLPPGDGQEMVLNTCGSCHNLKVVVHARKTHDDWIKCINDMIQRGAPLFPEEVEPLTNYLSKYFDATAPKLVNVNAASREELEKVPNMKPEVVTRILDARAKAGSFKNSEELRHALGMEKPEFDKILYSLKYTN